MPKMTHPDSKQTLEVAPGQVEMYESQGWTTKSPAVRASGKSGTAPRTTTTKKEEA